MINVSRQIKLANTGHFCQAGCIEETEASCREETIGSLKVMPNQKYYKSVISANALQQVTCLYSAPAETGKQL